MLEEPRRAYDFPLLRKDNTKLDAGDSFVTGYLGPGALLHAEALLKPCHLSSHSTAGVAQTQCKMATIDTTYFHYAKSAQDVDFLQSVSFLSESPRFKVAQFASMIETRTLEPQEHLVSCGELANQSVYIVKSGQLKLTVTLQVLLRPALLHVSLCPNQSPGQMLCLGWLLKLRLLERVISSRSACSQRTQALDAMQTCLQSVKFR